MLKMRLELLGDFDVVAAPDGEQGCAMALSERPDVILMDLEMPVVDGWEATRRLKDDPQTRDIPIIALSPDARARASARRHLREDATSSTPSRSNSSGWSRHCGGCSPLANDALVASIPLASITIAESNLRQRYGLLYRGHDIT